MTSEAEQMQAGAGNAPVGLSGTAAWEATLHREWLVVDGLGGYASGTVWGPHTRRYHGLLVAPLAPPLGRHVLLSKLEERVVVDGREIDLSANEFLDGTIAPRGFEALERFDLIEGVPVWRYTAGTTTIERRVAMERGHTSTIITYRLDGPATAALRLTPLCDFRDFHRETIGSEDWRFVTTRREGWITVSAYSGATPYHLIVLSPGGRQWTFGGHAGWWWHFLHRAERERGLDHACDLFGIGTIECALRPGESLTIVATIEDPAATRQRVAAAAEGHHRVSVDFPRPDARPEGSESPSRQGHTEGTVGCETPPRQALPEAAFVAQLRRAAHQFLVARAVPGEPASVGPDGVPEARTVLAGYHWFGDWGRDTMIALPGLAMATGRLAEARAILVAFSRYVDRGMLPNRFPDTGAPLGEGDYNTVDATLWYFHAVDAIDRLTGGGLVAELFPVLEQIVEWHVRGTRFGIAVDPADGLVRVENPQLTWMDAKVGDWVCTPRAGKPVEIAALWHHALALMARWAAAQGLAAAARRYETLRAAAEAGFRSRFWYAAGQYLYDVVDGPGGDDPSLRPNQAIAAGLPDCPLDRSQRKAVVDAVIDQLWTPRGLRTLSPADPQYRGRYSGDPWQRDGAYHQGTVWPWLLGPLVDAHLLVYGDKAAARRLVAPLRAHLFDEACAGSISEIFDGDAPHAPRGCIAQAWSVSEVYRAWAATAQLAARQAP